MYIYSIHIELISLPKTQLYVNVAWRSVCCVHHLCKFVINKPYRPICSITQLTAVSQGRAFSSAHGLWSRLEPQTQLPCYIGPYLCHGINQICTENGRAHSRHSLPSCPWHSYNLQHLHAACLQDVLHVLVRLDQYSACIAQGVD